MKAMEKWNTNIVVSIIVVGLLTTLAWKLGNWLWFRPKKLERYLRQQGVLGNPYRLFYGDMRERVAMNKQALSKPFNDFSNNVSARVAPFRRHLIQYYGKNSLMWIGPVPSVNIMNPKHIKDILMNINEFQKVEMHPLLKLLVPGVASCEGEKWAKHRKIINPAFHQQKLKLMIPRIYRSCDMMVNKWKLMKSQESCEIDVWPYLQNLSCDIISRSAFGSNYEEGIIMFDLLKELTQLLMESMQSVYIPGWRFLPTTTNKRIKQIEKEIKASLKNVIKKREEVRKTGEAITDDLLGFLMESNMREIVEKGSDKNSGLSINDVMDECRLLYFAGQETTSVFLVWTMILLSKFPYWQTSAREEVMQVFGKEKPNFEGLNHLKVVSMILYEVLRLYPPALVIDRTVHKEMKIGNLVLPKGIQVCLPTVFMHLDEEIWGNDASEFNPERFGEGLLKAAKQIGAFIPFGIGPRICVGQNFALLEAKIALVIILQNFTFELSPSYCHAPQIILTLKPQYGAPLILHRL